MKRVAVVVATAVVGLVGAVGAGWPAVARAETVVRDEANGFEPTAVYKVPLGASPAEGPVDAPVTIVAWSDYACGYCVRSQYALEAIERAYPDQIRLVHRVLPLDTDDTVAAESALAAAAQGKFKPMNDRLYEAYGRIDRVGAELLAEELGLDMIRFRADLDAHTYRTQIDADVADAVALGVAATPTFFVNGRPIAGALGVKVFFDLVAEELARARAGAGGYAALVGAGRPTADIPNRLVHRDGFELAADRTYQVGLGLPGHQRGKDSALVTIVAWGDFQCPFCAKLAPALEAVQAAHPDDVRVVFRHLPMSFHRKAALAAEAGVAAAAQGKFWAFHDQVFAQFGRLERSDLDAFAKLAGLDMVAFRAALDDRRYHDAVLAEANAAEALGVDGTPTCFVNGKPISGARTAVQLEAIVAPELARARATVQTGVVPSDVYALVMSGADGEEHGDPSRVPDLAAVRVAPRPEARSRSVRAACRLRDGERARRLEAGLTGPWVAATVRACAAVGIDLAPR